MKDYKSTILLLLILVIVTALRLALLDFPLERDEGEYAYMGQLILKGTAPYQHAYNMKWPGTYYVYALIMSLFGQSVPAIHLGYLLTSLISMVVMYRIGKHYYQERGGIIGAAVLGLLSVSPGVLGFAAHATQFLMMAALVGTWILLEGQKVPSKTLLLASGLSFGIAILMKQHALAMTAFAVVYILLSREKTMKQKVGDALVFIAGVLVPVSILIVHLQQKGALSNFWFWTIQYAASYTTQVSAHGAARNFMYGVGYITSSFPILWLLGVVAFVVVMFQFRNWYERRFLLLLTFFSVLSLLPGFYFRPHYFVTLIPAIAMLNASLLHKVSLLSGRTRIVVFSLVGLITASEFYVHREYYFSFDTTKSSYRIYGDENAFPLIEKVAKTVKSITNENDTILVFGSEPQIYFYSQRISATGFLYMYPFMEEHGNSQLMQRQMIREVERSLPEYVVNVQTAGSWGSNKTEKVQLLTKWFSNFSSKHYTRVSLYEVEAASRDLGNDPMPESTASSSYIEILKRNSN